MTTLHDRIKAVDAAFENLKGSKRILYSPERDSEEEAYKKLGAAITSLTAEAMTEDKVLEVISNVEYSCKTCEDSREKTDAFSIFKALKKAGLLLMKENTP